ncbi:uncharacterized protein LOC128993157 [Macrosteles quadrilineatus]|uniref:uncharacterized protein LOC128993157 n=1 Tax=Macrosteles quadrilineatus TaxID=74068 RepID=UPI0023E1EC86|nr:uncharacterized protein LOC128993157 [Macrosteles quadrilineatus]
MSYRKSNREVKPPKRYTPDQNENHDTDKLSKNVSENGKNDTQEVALRQPSITSSSSRKTKSKSATSSSRRQMEIELEKLEEIQKLERENEEKELERQRLMEEKEMELQGLELEKEIERQRLEKEMERQRLRDERELERRKQMLEIRTSMKSLSANGSQVCGSEVSISQSLISQREERESESKVVKWLNDNEPTVHQCSSTAMTTAAQLLADSVKKAIQPTSLCRQQLPNFSGRPDEWPMFFSAFENTVKLYSDDDNLARLRNCLEGEAFKMVKPLFVSSKNLHAIIKTLQMRFGRPEFIIESIMNQTRMLAPVTEDDIVGLIEFSTTILNFTSTAVSLHMEYYMTNPQLLSELLGKLPYQMKYHWAQHVSSMCLTRPSLSDFSDWLERQCSIMSIYFHPNKDVPTRKKNDFKPVLTNSLKAAVPAVDPLTCVFCGGKHDNDKCSMLRKADISERWKMLDHHRLLHNSNLERPPTKRNEGELKSRDEVIGNHFENNLSNRVLLRVCPVTLYGPKSQVDTYALLDDGSTVSLLDSSIADELGIKGEIVPLTTCWSNNTRHFESQSKRIDLKIKAFYEDEIFTLKGVRTQSTLELPHQQIDSVKLRKNWPHLNSINQPLPLASVRPTLLIGQDNCNLILTRKIIEGPTNAPVLSWCLLGWTLHGKCAQFRDRVDENFTLLSYEESSLHDMVKKSFELEKYGETRSNNLKLSIEEERGVSILEDTIKKTGDHYEVGLLWKNDEFNFPPSYDNALRRLNTLEKKMERNLEFNEAYTTKIDEYMEKGYIRKLSPEKAAIITDLTFYLPHFGVSNPNKPDKIRLVFDAAAKSHGVSFNDALLSGPDYLNPLPSVLLKFRLGKFAIVGDIKEMFHQVNIKDEDVDSQRFLWRKDKTKTPDTYIMKAMTFGATCSPSSALFVTINDDSDSDSDSTDTEEEAKQRVQEIIEIHRAGGFQICNWMSNSKQVLLKIPENLKASQAKHLMPDTRLPTERVLGLWWDAESDCFVFHRNVEKLEFLESEYPTKREILKAAMSIFDPLGLIAPTTVKGRLLVQDIWRTKLGWDDVVTPELSLKWKAWMDEVKSLRTLKIQRCYFNTRVSDSVELHIFVDASEEAFAATAYLRQENKDTYETTLIMSRAKVAPIKNLTIPRLELQAAVLGCRVASAAEQDLGVSIQKKTYWSDSQTVLHWIKSDPKNYKQFVSNRIGEIQELSSAEDWKWVPTKLNPADYATRSMKRFKSDIQNKWLHGPQFLSLNCEHWPTQPPNLQVKEDQETKRQFTGLHADDEAKIIDVSKFSSWEKPTRIVAWILRYVNNLKSRCKSNDKTQLRFGPIDYNNLVELEPKELKAAEEILLKSAQDETFGEERKLLMRKKSIPKSSRIYLFSPYLDCNNILRMSSRTSNSPELTEDQKNLIILDGRHFTSRLIGQMYHNECFHQGLETVGCKIREKFWITNLRPLLKKIKKECMRCRLNCAKPVPPQMAPLPEFRVTRTSHPFFYTGVDYFGPIEVTVGRRHEKRWGVLFICLTTRAVHLEVAHSLNTESCIMAIQRFISRRPCPSKMFSDNGTNFVGSDKELRNATKCLNNVHIQRVISRQGIKWNFIPPRAPHMGGCWERLIRSVKTALKFVMRSQYPKDEELQTFLVRIEFIINSRPLTNVPIDPLDPVPLTPNHFLRDAFKIDINEDKLCRRQLTRVKTLLDNFWKRWIHEYLPCLTRRCKWHKRTVPPEVDDLAIIVDEDNARNTWPLGRISALYPGRDGQVRVVDITTPKGTFRRPMTKIAILPEEGKDVND